MISGMRVSDAKNMSGILYYRAAQTEGQKTKLSESMWSAWTFISDPGTHAGEVCLFNRNLICPLLLLRSLYSCGKNPSERSIGEVTYR